jgi:hypothetical protein
LRIQYLQNPNVEKILQNQTTGEGIKRTPSYETPLSKSKLEQWRLEFWETRTSGSHEIWQLLRNACQEDAETASALILAADLTMPQNSLTTVIDTAGVYYRVPIACINDPVNYEKNYQLQQLKSKQAPQDREIKQLKIRLAPDKNVTVDISVLTSIRALKELFMAELAKQEQALEGGTSPSQLRFFYLGKELEEDLFLYSYDMKDEMTIQCMLRKAL